MGILTASYLKMSTTWRYTLMSRAFITLSWISATPISDSTWSSVTISSLCGKKSTKLPSCETFLNIREYLTVQLPLVEAAGGCVTAPSTTSALLLLVVWWSALMAKLLLSPLLLSPWWHGDAFASILVGRLSLKVSPREKKRRREWPRPRQPQPQRAACSKYGDSRHFKITKWSFFINCPKLQEDGVLVNIVQMTNKTVNVSVKTRQLFDRLYFVACWSDPYVQTKSRIRKLQSSACLLCMAQLKVNQ